MPFQLPKLSYPYNALEPHIDAKTMEIHHTKHHGTYTDNLNKLLDEGKLTDKYKADGNDASAILMNIESIPESIRTGIRNHGGGFMNHNLFWEIMGPKAGGEATGELADEIKKTFGSFSDFKEKFSDAAAKRFGSGWAWLSLKGGKLMLHSTANQDSPLMEGAIPILGLDVWEHAYYLLYQNKRAEYIKNWWNVINWPAVLERYKKAMKTKMK